MNYKSSLPKLKETVDSPSSEPVLRGVRMYSVTELMGRRPLQGTEGPRCPGSPLLDGAARVRKHPCSRVVPHPPQSPANHRYDLCQICSRSIPLFIHYFLNGLFILCIYLIGKSGSKC